MSIACRKHKSQAKKVNYMPVATHQEILKDLKTGKYQPVYFLQGAESYFIDTVADYIEAHALTEAEKGFNQTVIYGKDAEAVTVIDTARRYPMMAQRQVVLLREAQEMKGLDGLQKYIENPSPTTVLVICHKHKKVKLNTKFGKSVKANTVLLDAKPLYDNQVPDWIVGYLKSKKLTITPRAAELTAEYLGTELSKVANELDKLAINVPPGTQVTDKHIEENIGISREYNVFELQKAIGSRNVLKTNRIVNYFISNPKKNNIVPIIGFLSNWFGKLYMYHFVKSRPEREILGTLGLRSGWFLKEYRTAAANFPVRYCERAIAVLKEYDLRSKGIHLSADIADKEIGENTPPGELLREMIWKILH